MKAARFPASAPKHLVTRVLAGVTLFAAVQALSQDAMPGRVLAKVGDDAITDASVRFELGRRPSAVVEAAAEQAILDTIVARKVLAQEARRRGLDSSPTAAMLLRRADDLALVAVLQRSLVRSLPPVTDAEVSRYISEHPAMFARRKLVRVEQLQVADIDASVVRQMEPLETLDAILALLDRSQVGYVRSAAILDTLEMEPTAASRIGAMGANAVFISPTGPRSIEVSRVLASQPDPVTGPAAVEAARRQLTRTRNTAAVTAEMARIIEAGRSQVQINPDYATPLR